jgi:prevent-host-death family protein
MRTVSAAEANRQFSALLREVQEGGTVTITSRGLPVALLQPFDAERAKAEAAEREKRFQAMLEEWRSRPVMHLGKFNRDDAYD